MNGRTVWAVVFMTISFLVFSTVAYARPSGKPRATAELRDASGRFVGVAELTEDSSGATRLKVKVQGLTPGLHGIHFHSVALCEAPFSSAGGHFNPTSHQHGLSNPAGPHAGDLPNLEVNAAGVGRFEASSHRVSLAAGERSLFDADGSALIIHAGADDQVTDPAGNSGARIACGVITAR